MSAELAVVPPAEIMTQDTDSWVEVVGQVVRLAEHVAGTEFVPRGLRNNVPATTAAVLYGRELGLPPMTALSQISVIEGRPGLSAEGMRALVLAAGHEIVIDKATGAECVMRGRRRGSADWSAPVVWTIDMARAAQLLTRDNWRKYPRSMLVARASTELCRNVFPDVIHGFRSVEEIADIGAEPAPELEPAGPSTTKVARKRTPRKTAKTAVVEDTPGAPASSTTAPEPAGPPLPDEVDTPEAIRAKHDALEAQLREEITDERIDEGGYPAVAPTDATKDEPHGLVVEHDPRPPTPEEVGDVLAETRAEINRRLHQADDKLLPSPTARDYKDSEARREPHRPDDTDTLSRALAPGADVVEDLPEGYDEPLIDAAHLPAPGQLGPRGIDRATVRNIILHFARMGLHPDDDREERLMLTGRIVGRDVETTNDLSADEGIYVNATIRVVKDLSDLRKILDVVEDTATGEDS